MNRPTCESCVFFNGAPVASPEGWCFKGIPQVFVIGEHPNTMWPEVSVSDWCGEHPDFAAWVESRTEDGGKD
jgi:hypothetical protein